MKRRDLEKFLEENGYYFLRNSGHALWTNGTINVSVPHHKEINMFLAKKIMRTVKENINYHLRKVA
jgi:predicted RNA binding protein YcfA (HicA-like mRNA interferase family)